MFKRTYVDFIQDILEHIEKIERFTAGLDYAKFVEDEKAVYAVIRCFEIIREAVKNISVEVRNKYSSIPWSKMAGMRGKLIHSYVGVDYETLWGTVKKRIPEIKPGVEKILEDLGEE